MIRHFFYQSLPLLWGAFPTTMLLHSLKQVFWKRFVIYFISTIKIQFYYQSFTLNLLYFVLAKCSYIFSFILFWLCLVTCTFFYKRCFSNETQKLSESMLSVTNMCQKWILWIPYIFFVFIKGAQNHSWPDNQYENNDSINALILNLIML